MLRESPLRVLDAGAALAQLKQARRKEASKQGSKQARKRDDGRTQRKKKKRVTL